MADRMLRLVGDDPPRPRAFDMTGWSHERELLTAIYEAILRLTAWQVGAHSSDHKVPKVHSLPRPRTAIERARIRQAEESVAAVVAAFRPRDS